MAFYRNKKMRNIEQTPLGWEINMLYMFAHCAGILAEDIDMQLQNATRSKEFFHREKKKAVTDYNDCIEKCREYLDKAYKKMEVFDPDGATFEAVDKHTPEYNNVLSHCNMMIRFCMLFVDRCQADGADAKIFKFLRSLPEQGLFPESYIERFKMQLQLVPEVGDRIKSELHGFGTLEFNTCGDNWAVQLDNGEQIILNQKQFTIV